MRKRLITLTLVSLCLVVGCLSDHDAREQARNVLDMELSSRVQELGSEPHKMGKGSKSALAADALLTAFLLGKVILRKVKEAEA